MKDEWWQADITHIKKELGVMDTPPEPLPHRSIPGDAVRKRLESQAPKRLKDIPQLLTPLEVQRRCKFGATKLYYLIRQGEFKPVRNGRTFIPEDQVVAYLLKLMNYGKRKTNY